MELKEILILLTNKDLILLSIIGGTILVMFNMLGALSLLFLKKASQKLLDSGLGFRC